MKFGRFWTVIFFLICFNLSCTNILSKKQVTEQQIQKFHKQLKDNDWIQIYNQSSSSLKSRMTEQEFVNSIGSLVEKMKTVDATLNFQESEIDFALAGLNVDHEYSVKLEKLEENGSRIELVTHWNKDISKNEFKLASIVIVCKKESGEFENFFI
ncbi:MAG TPA: hypothetical protein PKY59_08290 [Pyrinomonadaceae bacterium]|nr:hypothetical protein [Pyrinomonadaceae bacterium]